MSRAKRQAVIIDVISGMDIETQKELTYELKLHGINVTQATISRDINELGLVKLTSNKTGKQRYVYNQPTEEKFPKLINLFQESVIKIDNAMNIVVLKTIAGSANTACLLIDKLGIQEIIGSVAGDDTVILVIDKISNVKVVIEKLESFLK